MIIINATLFLPDGSYAPDRFVRIQGTKISETGPMDSIITQGEPHVIDAQGGTLYPGFIDAHTHLGMFEDGLGFEGDDGNEDTDPCTPQLRAIDAVNPLDRCFQEAREAGVTTVLTGPGSANPIGGQFAAIKTDGKCIDDMVICAPAAMKFALGENPKSVYHDKNTAPVTRMATSALIREQLYKAREYFKRKQDCEEEDQPEYDIKCESLGPLLRGEIPAQIHAHRADDIFTAVRLAKEFGLRYSIVHCTQGFMAAQELAQKGVSAMCGPIISDRCKPELRESTPANPGLLDKAGVKVCIITDHPEVPIQYLPLCAGIAVRDGMDHTQALKAITIYPAEIAGISDRVGSIAVGKDADLVLYREDPLTVAARPECVIISGKVISDQRMGVER